MKNLEFQQGLELLKKQWSPTHFGQSRVEQLWDTFKDYRDGAFLRGCKALVFEGGYAPTGSKILEFVRARSFEISKPLQAQEIECLDCSDSGAILVFKRHKLANGRYSKNACVAACGCKAGFRLLNANKIHSVQDIEKHGYRARGE